MRAALAHVGAAAPQPVKSGHCRTRHALAVSPPVGQDSNRVNTGAFRGRIGAGRTWLDPQSRLIGADVSACRRAAPARTVRAGDRMLLEVGAADLRRVARSV